MARAATTLAAAIAAVLIGSSSAAANTADGAGNDDARQLAPGLSFDFYKRSCPNAEPIVRSFVQDAVRRDVGLAAGLLRLHFHDCFVQGCDASVLLDGSATGPGEQQAPPNLTLRPTAFKAINDLHARLNRECSGGGPTTTTPVVSCSDVLALAARDAVVVSGGPSYRVPLGRRDSVGFATRADVLSGLPPPTAAVPALMGVLAKIGLHATDLVALSGGHTIGLGHCASFEARLFPRPDPTLNATLAAQLRRTCPAVGTDRRTALDVRTPNAFDNKYYVNLVNREGLFTSDQDLFSNPGTRPLVQRFARSQREFFDEFAKSVVKMGQIKVLTGKQGQIRTNCSARNAGNGNDHGRPWSVVVEEAAESLVFF